MILTEIQLKYAAFMVSYQKGFRPLAQKVEFSKLLEMGKLHFRIPEKPVNYCFVHLYPSHVKCTPALPLFCIGVFLIYLSTNALCEVGVRLITR